MGQNGNRINPRLEQDGARMDGVTILNAYQTYSFGGAVLLSAGIVGSVTFAFTAIAFLDENVYISGFFAGLAIVLAIGCFGIRKMETRYEVILDDGVSWTEFSEHYEVLRIRGKILTVREVKDD